MDVQMADMGPAGGAPPPPTPLGTCGPRTGNIYGEPHERTPGCINWTPEPSPGTDKVIVNVPRDDGTTDVYEVQRAEGLEPPPLSHGPLWTSDGLAESEQTVHELVEDATRENDEWHEKVSALTARLAESEQRAERYREVVEKAKEVYKHMTVDSAGVAPDEAKLIAALNRLEDNHPSPDPTPSPTPEEKLCQELAEALEEITRLDGNQVGPNIARAALAALDPTTGERP